MAETSIQPNIHVAAEKLVKKGTFAVFQTIQNAF